MLRLLGMNELAGDWLARVVLRVDEPELLPKLPTVVRVELWRAPKLSRAAGCDEVLPRAPPKLTPLGRWLLAFGRCVLLAGR